MSIVAIPFSSLLEELSALINKAETDKVINGLKINARCPLISHLFFANDNLLFF